eukprot:90191-Chlamydomonas_euryale.AAC.1
MAQGMRLVALPAASSGIAGILMEGGATAHSRFKIPIDLGAEGFCSIGGRSALANVLRKTSMLIWDGTPMTHKHTIEAVDRSLRDLYIGHEDEAWRAYVPFAGKIMVFGGDFRHILPVVPESNRAGTVAASLKRSELWSKMEVFKLTENMRVKKMADLDTGRAHVYEKWASDLLDIGN